LATGWQKICFSIVAQRLRERFHPMYCAPRDESFFICMTPQSLAIYELPPAIDLRHSKGGGVDTIPSGSTISGESCSGGSLVKLLTSPCLIITSSVTTMTKRTQKQPANPFHPGEILLEEFLEPGGITQTAFATKVGWTKARLNELIKGRRGITADAALDLAETLGTSARLWMNLQSTFDLAQAEKKRRAA
jgi:addiction module HigA family antidote